MSLPTYTEEQAGDYIADGHWESTTGATYSYLSFEAGAGDTLQVYYGTLNDTEVALASAALEAWSTVTGIIFEETSNYFLSEIDFTNIGTGASAGPSAFNTTTGEIAYSGVNIGTAWTNYYGGELGDYSFQTYIHEIGHALGLGHAGDYDGDATFDDDAHYANDSWQMSIMSYFSPDENPFVTGDEAFVITPMIADIEAMEILYGLNPNVHVGDTVWGANSNIGGYLQDIFDDFAAGTLDYAIALTIHDTDGIDTIDLSTVTDTQTINLNEAAISSIGGVEGNMVIANGTIIENVIGGSDTDTITGNGVANLLRGAGGDDQISGAGGNDTLSGELGHDTLWGGSGNDTVYGGAGDDRMTGDNGNDTLRAGAGNDTASGGNGADFVYSGAGDDTAYGGAGDDRVYGDAGSDLLYGGNGYDILVGGAGDDIVYGGNGRDSAYLHSGDDTFHDNGQTTIVGSDSVWGGAGNDTIYGGAGDDLFRGETGYDLIYGGDDNDQIWGGGGSDTLYGDAGDDRIAGGKDDDTIYGGDGDDKNWGGDGNDIIYGGIGNDLLSGQNGDDDLDGADGSDTIYGGNGVDTITGGSGVDMLFGGAGGDTFIFAEGAGLDTIADFDLTDSLTFDDAIWGGGLTVDQVITEFADIVEGTAQFDFGDGNQITLSGVSTLEGLADTISIV